MTYNVQDSERVINASGSIEGGVAVDLRSSFTATFILLDTGFLGSILG